MTAAIPAAPANLLKALAEDPITYEKEMGCMTGILQIFDRHRSFTGRRYGSKRVNSSVNGIRSLTSTRTALPCTEILFRATWMFICFLGSACDQIAWQLCLANALLV